MAFSEKLTHKPRPEVYGIQWEINSQARQEVYGIL